MVLPLALTALLAAAASAATSPGEPAAAAAMEPAAWLSAVGDIRLDGPVGELARREGPGAPTAASKALLAADIVFGNLETPVTERGRKTPKTWNFRAPPALLPVLREGGFTVLNLANNHVWDYGREGFLDTLSHLEAAGEWRAVGAGLDRERAEAPLIVAVNGLRVGFLGLTSTRPEEAWAAPGKPGVAFADLARLPRIVARARAACDALVVSFHGGTELAPEPNDIQISAARASIDAGADLFLGHHPHVLQPVELYKGKPILYSLGNFLFVSPTPATRTTVVARVRLTRRGAERVELYPAEVDGGRPRPAPPGGPAWSAAREALDRRGALSSPGGPFAFAPGG